MGFEGGGGGGSTGPRGRSRTSLPLPRHCAQVAGVPDLEPLPAHVAHLMLRDRLSLRVPPLYISSRVTLRAGSGGGSATCQC